MTRGGWRRWLWLLTPALILLAAVLVVRVLRQFTLEQVLRSIEGLHRDRLLGAALCTAGSYAVLTGFDWLGLRYAGGRLGYGRIALAAFVNLSIGHTVGVAPLSSGAIRYRLYSKWGLDAAQVGLIVLFSAVTVALGETALAGIALLVNPALAEDLLGVPAGTARLIGAAALVPPIAYVGLAATVRRARRAARSRGVRPLPP